MTPKKIRMSQITGYLCWMSVEILFGMILKLETNSVYKEAESNKIFLLFWYLYHEHEWLVKYIGQKVLLKIKK